MSTENDLKHKLKETKNELLKTKAAIWDMLNYANMYVLLLDNKMNIQFTNYNLAITLGFENEFEPIGRCWLDFIKEKDQKLISNIHQCLITGNNCDNYREFVSDIITKDGTIITVKWFNAPVNHSYNWTFSFGLVSKPPAKITEDSIRSYYRDVLAKDRTMIQSMRDMIIGGIKRPDSCEPDLK